MHLWHSPTSNSHSNCASSSASQRSRRRRRRRRRRGGRGCGCCLQGFNTRAGLYCFTCHFLCSYLCVCYGSLRSTQQQGRGQRLHVDASVRRQLAIVCGPAHVLHLPQRVRRPAQRYSHATMRLFLIKNTTKRQKHHKNKNTGVFISVGERLRLLVLPLVAWLFRLPPI
jgi:hypothetical protein